MNVEKSQKNLLAVPPWAAPLVFEARRWYARVVLPRATSTGSFVKRWALMVLIIVLIIALSPIIIVYTVVIIGFVLLPILKPILTERACHLWPALKGSARGLIRFVKYKLERS